MQHHDYTTLIKRSLAIAALAGGAVWVASQQRTASAMAEAQPISAPVAATVSATPVVALAARPTTARESSASRALLEGTISNAPEQADDADTNERDGRRARARAELTELRAQDPRSFLTIFDVMKNEGKDAAALAPLRHVTERYISTRGVLLERMLTRFIDDPTAEHALELEQLERLAREYRRELDWYAQKVPDVSNFDEILATTTLKLPSFSARFDAEESRATDPDSSVH